MISPTPPPLYSYYNGAWGNMKHLRLVGPHLICQGGYSNQLYLSSSVPAEIFPTDNTHSTTWNISLPLQATSEMKHISNLNKCLDVADDTGEVISTFPFNVFDVVLCPEDRTTYDVHTHNQLSNLARVRAPYPASSMTMHYHFHHHHPFDGPHVLAFHVLILLVDSCISHRRGLVLRSSRMSLSTSHLPFILNG